MDACVLMQSLESIYIYIYMFISIYLAVGAHVERDKVKYPT